MRVRGLIAPAIAVALLAGAGTAGAVAREFKIFGIREDRTKAFTQPGGQAMAPYGATLHGEILSEIRSNYLPFRLISPAIVLVRFAVNRRGELVGLSVAKKSRAKVIDDYVLLMVSQASRRFPPPPSDQPDDRLAFALPIRLQ